MSPVDEFRGAAPAAQTVSLNVPAGAGASTARSGRRDAEMIGQRATFYEITRGVTTIVNGGVGVTLLVLEAIVDEQPTTLTADARHLGPVHRRARPDDVEVRRQSKVGTSDYSYVLSAKPRNAADTRVRRRSSRATAHVVSRVVGSGDFVFDFSALHALDRGNTRRAASACTTTTPARRAWSRSRSRTSTTATATTRPNDALYKYSENGDHSGSFEFVTKADVDHDPLGVQETLAIKSVWLSTGQGKSDVGATGGSLAAGRHARGVLGHARSRAPTSPTRGTAPDTEGERRFLQALRSGVRCAREALPRRLRRRPVHARLRAPAKAREGYTAPISAPICWPGSSSAWWRCRCRWRSRSPRASRRSTASTPRSSPASSARCSAARASRSPARPRRSSSSSCRSSTQVRPRRPARRRADGRRDPDRDGRARLGRLIQFVPHPVTTGFTAGIARRDRHPPAQGLLRPPLSAHARAATSSSSTRCGRRAAPRRGWRARHRRGTLALLLVAAHACTKRVPAPLVALAAGRASAPRCCDALSSPASTSRPSASRFSYDRWTATRYAGIPPLPPLPMLPVARRRRRRRSRSRFSFAHAPRARPAGVRDRDARRDRVAARRRSSPTA